MSQPDDHLFEFGPFRLDLSERQLFRDGKPVSLTPKDFETLVMLVSKRGHVVEKNELLKEVWKATFVEEANISRHVWMLRKTLGEDENGQSYIETIPKRGYRFVANLAEPGNGGDQLVVERRSIVHITAEEDDEKPGSTPDFEQKLLAATREKQKWAGWRWGPGVLAVLVIGVGVALYHNWTEKRRSQADVAVTAMPTSIAVLPFVNASNNPDVEYLSDGMTESLIDNLSQLPHLSVKARSSVFRYKGREVEPQTIAAELSVQAILTGRVVQHGDDLALYLSLVDGRNGNQIWGDEYNRKLTDLVSLQHEIARDVSHKLRVRLSGADEQRLAKYYPSNAEAYRLFLKGSFHQSKGTPQDLRKAIEYDQQVIALDPNFALAYAGLAYAYAPLSDFNDPTSRDLMLKAKEAALHALALDEQLLEAHTALGMILYRYDYDFAGAEREYKRAIELNPNDSDAHQEYGAMLSFLGRSEESLAELRRALEIDPVSSGASWKYGQSLFFARRYDEAIAHLKTALELDANYASTHYALAINYQMKRDFTQSVAERAKTSELLGAPQTAALMRESFAKSGWHGFLRAMTSKQRAPDYVTATFQIELGEKDKALARLNKMYEDRAHDLVMLRVDPRLDPLRSDPRFTDLMRRVGLPR
jgi:TolB-like protein/DNA-binding winged helix-turn-helix (wHTH) protein/tetratricopeptide (TPR) repeat protein